MRPILLMLCFAGASSAQLTPLRIIGVRPTPPKSISMISIHFEELKYGHEGPDYFSVDHAPYRGKRAIVEASLYGQESLSSVKFELVDQFGMTLSTPAAIRTGSGADSDGYLLLVDVPLQPFRFAIRGQDLRGERFDRVDGKLYMPVEGTPAPIELPPGLPAAEAEAMRRMLGEYEKQTQTQFDEARRQHPDGVLRFSRSEVLESAYEPLRSPAGHEIGIRLHLTVRFGADGDYMVSPSLFPNYQNADWRQITLKTVDAAVNPAPANPSADMLDDVLRYGGAARYAGGQTYRFQFDLIPNYLIRNVAKTRYCIYSEQFRVGRMQLWEAIQASEAPVKYRVEISSLDFHGETGELPAQRLYLENFRRDGAGDCGPSPTNRF